MGERFLKILKEMGYTNVAFAKEIGISEGKVRDIIKSRVNSISPEILSFIAKKGYNLHWLLTGEGEMYLGTPKEEVVPTDPSIKDIEQFLKSHPEFIPVFTKLMQTSKKLNNATEILSKFTEILSLPPKERDRLIRMILAS